MSDTAGERVLVCGGRDYDDVAHIYATLDTLDKKVGITRIISGGAEGADSFAHLWAVDRHKPTDVYLADWNKWGKGAGPLRNQRMIDEGKPTLVVAFPGGRGTADMCRRARDYGIPIYRPQTAYRSPAVKDLDKPETERRG